MHDRGGGGYVHACLVQHTECTKLLSNSIFWGAALHSTHRQQSAVRTSSCSRRAEPFTTQKGETDENVAPGQGENAFSKSKNHQIVLNPKHIHLIRKIISDVVHELDVDSRWTCTWTSIMHFPDDKINRQIHNSQQHCKATYAQQNQTLKDRQMQTDIRRKKVLIMWPNLN